MLKSKKCSKCGKTKDVSNFFKQCDTPDGYQYQCKQCSKEYDKKHYQKNKEKILAKRKIYYQKTRVDRMKQKADCRGCNSAIGFLKDNPIFCENAGRYLRKYS